jgi:hypothetical protein
MVTVMNQQEILTGLKQAWPVELTPVYSGERRAVIEQQELKKAAAAEIER